MHGAMLEIVQISLGFRELIQGADIVILSSQYSPKSHIITHTRGDGEDIIVNNFQVYLLRISKLFRTGYGLELIRANDLCMYIYLRARQEENHHLLYQKVLFLIV